jgi:phosphate transport system substrate-binding protein
LKRLVTLGSLMLAVTILTGACGTSSGSQAATSTGGSGSAANGASSTSVSAAGTPSTAAAATSSPKTANPSAAVTLNESGSSLLYPFLQELVKPFHSKYPNVTLAPSAGGSGKGISDAAAGTTEFGGSDAYLSPALASEHQGLENVPVVVSAQAINYNLKGVGDLHLSGRVLAGMYDGHITMWNDPAIAKLNPGRALPAQKVVPLRRVDSSGDTFIFTGLLSKTDSAWANSTGMGTTVTWPSVSDELTANGNPGMVQTCSATPGCVAYVGVSAESAAQSAGLEEARLQNAAGNFVIPTRSTIQAAVNALSGALPDSMAQSLIYEKGGQAYPIVNFEYIIVNKKQPNPATAQAIRDFLAFATDPAQGSQSEYLSKEDFVALPSGVLAKVDTTINGIGS